MELAKAVVVLIVNHHVSLNVLVEVRRILRDSLFSVLLVFSLTKVCHIVGLAVEAAIVAFVVVLEGALDLDLVGIYHIIHLIIIFAFLLYS